MVDICYTTHDQEWCCGIVSTMQTREVRRRHTKVKDPAKESDFRDVNEVIPFP